MPARSALAPGQRRLGECSHPFVRWSIAKAQLGSGQSHHRLANRASNQDGQYQIEWSDTGDKSNVEVVNVGSVPSDLVATAQVLIQNGCQNQLDLLVSGASKSSATN